MGHLAVLTFALLACGAVLGCPAYFEDDEEFFTREYADPRNRLPDNIVPQSYDLELKPDIETETLEGKVVIIFKATKANKIITLHGRDITFTKDDVNVESVEKRKVMLVKSVAENEDKQQHNIELVENMAANGEYKLQIEYKGKLHRDNSGFYIAEYEEGGQKKKMATTQFESISARKAFPCFDEPHLKATFTTKIRRKKTGDWISISNEKLKGNETVEDDEDVDHVYDVYKTTVKMSTYLNAFVVTQFKAAEKKEFQGHRVWARPEAVQQKLADYALEVGYKTLNALESYADYKYSSFNSKMDQIGIPDKYFAAGAMENWGLVTYRENYLLYSPNYTTTNEKQTINTIIAHEFAHQWFGNLVTMDWWNHLWLNEGFATYFEQYAASLIEPTWRLMDQYVLKNVQRALERDAQSGTNHMNSEGSPGSGPPTFIAYQKAGSVIRMFENFMSESTFKKGLQYYLKDMQYKAAQPKDLYKNLQKAIEDDGRGSYLGGAKFETILQSWDAVVGYPVVTVVVNYKEGKLNLTQERFWYGKVDKPTKDNLWYVPINFVQGKKTTTYRDFLNTTASHWLKTKQQNIEGLDKNNEWIILNKQQTGYYRVNYDADTWNRLIKVLTSDDHVRVSFLNKAQLIDDAFNLARADSIKYDVAFKLGNYLSRETDYIPLSSFINAIHHLNIQLLNSPSYAKFKTYITDALQGAYKHLTLKEKPTDTHLDKLNRANVLSWLCKLGHAACRDEAHKQLKAWIAKDENQIAPDFQTAFYCAGVAKGDQKDWDGLFQKYKNVKKTLLQKGRILKALACTENDAVATGYLNKIIDEKGGVEVDDRTTAYQQVVASGSVGLNAAFKHFSAKYKEIKTAKVNTKSVLTFFATLFNTKADKTKLEQLAAKYPEDKADIDKAIKTVDDNIKWIDSKSAEITKWLGENVRGAGAQTKANIAVLFLAAFAALYRLL